MGRNQGNSDGLTGMNFESLKAMTAPQPSQGPDQGQDKGTAMQ
jgi:hypothetical protein